ncbi:hypothetical protein [Spirochaeta lutea]|uniref:Uncharacterized protein n=1 Tax=Spirochaeta lutea TaxID=1480694 RepID=A0A098R058_9SPIO|nr:hypothetical protein [Spirochaeta lutea]KGE73545.1 hypothetical protein DC28_02455 [Spirochaeta lutea]
MSLRPIDLQNLFLRLNQISKQQAAAQEAAAHAQSVEGQELEESAKAKQKRVSKPDEIQEGPEQSHFDEESPEESGRRRGTGSKNRKKGKDSSDESDDSLFKDPDLGTHIDIST